jgi:hypothetical protein
VAGRWSSLSRKPESRFLNPFLSMSTPNALVQKLWNYCNILRDDGLSYGDYVEQLTFLLFLKMADEQTKPPFNPPSPGGLRRAGNPSPVPAQFSWPELPIRDGDDLEIHYRQEIRIRIKIRIRRRAKKMRCAPVRPDGRFISLTWLVCRVRLL